MCIYDDVIGFGPVLELQIITFFVVVTSTTFWMWIYQRQNVPLKAYAIPIILWILFGTLDILVTAKGTFSDPHREGNPLTRYILINVDYLGPVVATILWISLWAGLVLLVNRTKHPYAGFVSLAAFYSLAAGHLFGFSSWYLPFCGIAKIATPLTSNLLRVILIGTAAGAVHYFVTRFYKSS